MKKRIAKHLVLLFVATISLGNALSAYAATATHNQTVNFTINDSITLGGDATVTFSSNLTPGGAAVSQSGNVTVSTNADGGFSVAIDRSTSRTATMKHTVEGTDFTDKTLWNSSTGNSATWSGDGFGFRVMETGTYACAFNSTWWGTDAAAKYAGVPNNAATNNTIASCATAQDNTSRTLVMGYRAEAPSTQTAGAYQGVIRYTGTTL
jgi:hypothetical protein